MLPPKNDSVANWVTRKEHRSARLVGTQRTDYKESVYKLRTGFADTADNQLPLGVYCKGAKLVM